MRNGNTHAESSVASETKVSQANIVQKAIDEVFGVIQRYGPAINQIVEILHRNRRIIRVLIRTIMDIDIGD